MSADHRVPVRRPVADRRWDHGWSVQGQPVAEPLNKIHPLVQDGDNQRRIIVTEKAENIVMLNTVHP